MIAQSPRDRFVVAQASFRNTAQGNVYTPVILGSASGSRSIEVEARLRVQRIVYGTMRPKVRARPAPRAVSTSLSRKLTANESGPETPLTSRTTSPEPADETYQRLVRTAIIAETAPTVMIAIAISVGPWRMINPAAITPAKVAAVRPRARLASTLGSGRMMNIAAAATHAMCPKSSK